MTDIFLSYNEKDREQARRLAAMLESVGWTVWWDRRIPAGETWRSVLEDALENMRCMVVLWSAHSIESELVYEEATEGRRLGKLIPILIEAVRPPAGFREIQAADLTDWDGSREFEGLRMLLADLEHFLGQPTTPSIPTDPGNAVDKTEHEVTTHWWQRRSLASMAVAGSLVLAGGVAYLALPSRPQDVVPPEVEKSVQQEPNPNPSPVKPTPPVVAPVVDTPPPKPAPPVVATITEVATSPVTRPASVAKPTIKHPLNPKLTSSRCANLLARTQLGESLSEKAQTYYEKECQ